MQNGLFVVRQFSCFFTGVRRWSSLDRKPTFEYLFSRQADPPPLGRLAEHNSPYLDLCWQNYVYKA